MGRSKTRNPEVIDPAKYGVSFSLKQCRNFGISPHETLSWLLEKGFRRFRLMSYWDEHEKQPGKHDFKELDWQIAQIAAAGGEVTLCLGVRQPRWPENHWPTWAWKLVRAERSKALLQYVEKVVTRYKHEKIIVSYQLENEALLKSFGERPDIDRRRLRDEANLVKNLDPDTPLIMTTSTHWGIPLRRPIPDIIGFSYYHTVYSRKQYRTAGQQSWLHIWRAKAIRMLWGRESFIHELQLEPWGPQGIWHMPMAEQDRSMSPALIRRNIALARKVGLYPIDMWGAEWWYWCLVKRNDPAVWHAVRDSLL